MTLGARDFAPISPKVRLQATRERQHLTHLRPWESPLAGSDPCITQKLLQWRSSAIYFSSASVAPRYWCLRQLLSRKKTEHHHPTKLTDKRPLRVRCGQSEGGSSGRRTPRSSTDFACEALPEGGGYSVRAIAVSRRLDAALSNRFECKSPDVHSACQGDLRGPRRPTFRVVAVLVRSRGAVLEDQHQAEDHIRDRQK